MTYEKQKNKVDKSGVNKKWQALLEFEAQVMQELGTHESIHG
jgi:hypothetical protein